MRLFRFKPRRGAEAAKVGVSAAEEEEEGRQGLLNKISYTPAIATTTTNSSSSTSSDPRSIIELPNLQNLYVHSAPVSRQQEQAVCTTQIVTLKAFIHCQGCARRLKKTLSKLQGVNTYHVDMDLQKVTVIGSLRADEVLQSVNKVLKGTQLWAAPNNGQPTSPNNAISNVKA